jgi:hypothetical protein
MGHQLFQEQAHTSHNSWRYGIHLEVIKRTLAIDVTKESTSLIDSQPVDSLNLDNHS